MSPAEPIVIAHLYPREMNIYGDLGNVITLRRRLEWRGFEVKVEPVEIGRAFDFGRADIIFGGGGQDRGQSLVGPDLLARRADLHLAAEAGVPMLMVCGLYQLFGHGFTTATGQQIPGIGIFDARTVATDTRMIGNIVVESRWGRLVGFENHSGATELAKGQPALGKVGKGFGNTPGGKQEGAVTGNAIGTYLHGPVLPKNPVLADWLISQALHRLGITDLEKLDDSLELRAATSAAKRPR